MARRKTPAQAPIAGKDKVETKQRIQIPTGPVMHQYKILSGKLHHKKGSEPLKPGDTFVDFPGRWAHIPKMVEDLGPIGPQEANIVVPSAPGKKPVFRKIECGDGTFDVARVIDMEEGKEEKVNDTPLTSDEADALINAQLEG